MKLQPSNGSDKLVIPAGDWSQAIRQMWDLRAQEEISTEQWHLIVDWLTTASFSDEAYMAGEVAYSLIRDRAPPEIQSLIQVETGPPPKCRRSFQRVTGSNPSSEEFESIEVAIGRLRDVISPLESTGVRLSMNTLDLQESILRHAKGQQGENIPFSQLLELRFSFQEAEKTFTTSRVDR